MTVTLTPIGNDYLVVAPHQGGRCAFRLSAVLSITRDSKGSAVSLMHGAYLIVDCSPDDLIDALSPEDVDEAPSEADEEAKANARRQRALYLLERSS